MRHNKFSNVEVGGAFDAYPKAVRDKLLFLRELIFEVAEETAKVGEIEATRGELGPKLTKRDRQVPEGMYKIID